MKSKSKKRNRQMLIVVGLCALAGFLTPATEAADHRMRVRVDEPFEIDGRMSDPAVVMLREVGPYSPGETLNEVWIGNTSLGPVVGRSFETEGVARDHSMVFARSREGHLVLVAVAFRGGPAMTLHRIGAPDPVLGEQVSASLMMRDR